MRYVVLVYGILAELLWATTVTMFCIAYRLDSLPLMENLGVLVCAAVFFTLLGTVTWESAEKAGAL
jgi:Na+/proline symporter